MRRLLIGLTLIILCGSTLYAQTISVDDNFNDNSLDTVLWSKVDPASQISVSESSQQLRITVPQTLSAWAWNGLQDNTVRDYTGGSAQVELLQSAPAQWGGGMNDYVWLLTENGSRFEIYTLDNGNVVFGERVSGTLYYDAAAYNSVSMRFMRIRHDSSTNTVYWETSPDGSSWTVRYSKTPTLAVTALRFEIFTVASYASQYPVTAIYDNVHLQTLTPTPVPNSPPLVSITSPTNGATFSANSNLTINASASDSDGTVSKVEFFQGTTKLGEATSSPYSFTWNNVTAGTYTITAKATDNVGATQVSDAVSIIFYTRISGKVTRSDGTTAIAGTTVKIFQGSSLVTTVTANGNGDFLSSGLPPGSYSVTASAAGYQPKTTSSVGLTAATGATANFSLNSSDTSAISYSYDEAGRLVGVVNPAGDSVKYSYDAVGNLLSISKQSSTLVGIIRFTPDAGPVGTALLIEGTGFSTTASQDTVTVNGTSATVTSSSATQIFATVPSGATTGPLVITSPAGTATSATSFTVVNAVNNAPTITGFTPLIGAPGTSVTINGTNFGTITTNNKVRFNTTRASVNSSTGTSMVLAAPPGTSGRISLTTLSGTATSAEDFFVSPPPYAASDVEVTGRMALGESKTVTLSIANKIALIIFDGMAGQRFSLNMPKPDMTIYDTRVAVLNPDGTVLADQSANTWNSAIPTNFIDAKTLPVTGTYTIMVDPQSTYVGSIKLMLYSVPQDVTNTLSIGGSAVSVNISNPGQNAQLSFSGTANQQVTIRVRNNSMGLVKVEVHNPDGTILNNQSATFQDASIDMPQTLSVAGTYTIVIDPSLANTGSMDVSILNQ